MQEEYHNSRQAPRRGTFIPRRFYELGDTFTCGFCGTVKPWALHGYADGRIRYCTNCVNGLDALRDGVDDALRIFRGESS